MIKEGLNDPEENTRVKHFLKMEGSRRTNNISIPHRPIHCSLTTYSGLHSLTKVLMPVCTGFILTGARSYTLKPSDSRDLPKETRDKTVQLHNAWLSQTAIGKKLCEKRSAKRNNIQEWKEYAITDNLPQSVGFIDLENSEE